MVASSADRPLAAATAVADRFSAATVHEAAGRVGALPARLRPAYAAAVYGPAFPVLCPGGDNLWLHRAVAEAAPGDVLVVQTTSTDEYGYWGEILSEAARARGLSGLVLDGGVRDLGALERVGFPVFSSSICIKGTVKDPDGSGRLGGPIRIGDVRIERGDLIVGDEDGVVVIPQHRWPEVLESSREREDKEARIIAEIRSGASTLDLYSLPR
ncbi:4-carboxy-4-hydroxy-2-oxoadipate aldolase/oxaloacetate decarboxylase [Rhodococcus koreensis]|uniref:4-carboxy-4-hydroxy-2-oxoadipate aldolase/oxaloacetate decarboxylase n=1 Tax=Rhodococcus koreensis TaxID=99653 RepID=UPI001981EFB9|nr:4-carboxy-4-hydroxy-2-oxoadipate aldolase/oxaloacetate decarboxylase [Rhodococcus koreensis]QSE86634.1 4-carboxy-4-hydroxy-2-oxoadipate aldolase/oxaloacetate decarboxylase [Rhodococcus koreensis]